MHNEDDSHRPSLNWQLTVDNRSTNSLNSTNSHNSVNSPNSPNSRLISSTSFTSPSVALHIFLSTWWRWWWYIAMARYAFFHFWRSCIDDFRQNLRKIGPFSASVGTVSRPLGTVLKERNYTGTVRQIFDRKFYSKAFVNEHIATPQRLHYIDLAYSTPKRSLSAQTQI